MSLRFRTEYGCGYRAVVQEQLTYFTFKTNFDGASENRFSSLQLALYVPRHVAKSAFSLFIRN